jgi:hypothetical protein
VYAHVVPRGAVFVGKAVYTFVAQAFGGLRPEVVIGVAL